MTEFRHIADLRSLRAAIARSPIVVRFCQAPAAARDFADWCETASPDIDAVILAWLRSHVPLRAPRLFPDWIFP